MKPDSSASMRLWAVDVELGGRVYGIPPLPAADWWPVLAGTDPLGATLAMIPESSALDDQLLAGEIELSSMIEALTDAIEQACGRTLHEAMAIATVAQEIWWWVGGRLARYGFRWDVMPIGAALDAVHGLIMENFSDEAKRKYEAALKRPAVGGGRKPKIDRAQALADHAAVVGALPPRGVALIRPDDSPLQSSGARSSGILPRTQPQLRSRRPRVLSAAPTSPPERPA